ISPYFITNADKMRAEMEDPYILIYEKKLSGLQELLPLLEAVVQAGKPLLIVAEEGEGEALATLVINKLRGGVKVAAVEAPGFGDRRKAMLQDIAILTGGQTNSEDLGIKLDKVTVDMLGRAKKVLTSCRAAVSPCCVRSRRSSAFARKTKTRGTVSTLCAKRFRLRPGRSRSTPATMDRLWSARSWRRTSTRTATTPRRARTVTS